MFLLYILSLPESILIAPKFTFIISKIQPNLYSTLNNNSFIDVYAFNWISQYQQKCIYTYTAQFYTLNYCIKIW